MQAATLLRSVTTLLDAQPSSGNRAWSSRPVLPVLGRPALSLALQTRHGHLANMTKGGLRSQAWGPCFCQGLLFFFSELLMV